jgi:hypothetical protein
VMTALTKATPHPDVLDTDLPNGEVVLLHMGTNQYYSLNETGSHVWRLMGRGLTLGEIIEDLEARFDVSPDQAHQSVVGLANQLTAEHLVCPGNG